jgi:hypothetical protein
LGEIDEGSSVGHFCIKLVIVCFLSALSPTSLDLIRLHVLSRHRVVPNNVW